MLFLLGSSAVARGSVCACMVPARGLRWLICAKTKVCGNSHPTHARPQHCGGERSLGALDLIQMRARCAGHRARRRGIRRLAGGRPPAGNLEPRLRQQVRATSGHRQHRLPAHHHQQQRQQQRRRGRREQRQQQRQGRCRQRQQHGTPRAGTCNLQPAGKQARGHVAGLVCLAPARGRGRGMMAGRRQQGWAGERLWDVCSASGGAHRFPSPWVLGPAGGAADDADLRRRHAWRAAAAAAQVRADGCSRCRRCRHKAATMPRRGRCGCRCRCCATRAPAAGHGGGGVASAPPSPPRA